MREMFFGRKMTPELERVQKENTRNPARTSFATRRMAGATPGNVLVAQKATATTAGWQFKFYLVGGNISGYRIYRSTINNANVATAVDHIPQPPTRTYLQTYTWQETTADTPFYWVATVSKTGKEGTRIPMVGAAAPIQPPEQGPPPSSGFGEGVGSEKRRRIFVL